MEESLPAATNRVAPYQVLAVGKLAHRAEPPALLKPPPEPNPHDVREVSGLAQALIKRAMDKKP